MAQFDSPQAVLNAVRRLETNNTYLVQNMFDSQLVFQFMKQPLAYFPVEYNGSVLHIGDFVIGFEDFPGDIIFNGVPIYKGSDFYKKPFTFKEFCMESGVGSVKTLELWTCDRFPMLNVPLSQFFTYMAINSFNIVK
jgi:hypothetical protein